jgi:hypothetical protein
MRFHFKKSGYNDVKETIVKGGANNYICRQGSLKGRHDTQHNDNQYNNR